MSHELAVEIVDASESSDLKASEAWVVNPCLAFGQWVACRNGKPVEIAGTTWLRGDLGRGNAARVLIAAGPFRPIFGVLIADVRGGGDELVLDLGDANTLRLRQVGSDTEEARVPTALHDCFCFEISAPVTGS